MRVDGRLDEEIWRGAPRYDLRQPVARSKKRSADAIDPGFFQLAWDQTYLYFAATLSDRDLHAWSEENQRHHYLFGDVCELFLNPAGSTWYWELYVTPRGNHTMLWYPGAGLIGIAPHLPAPEQPADLVAAAVADGTINQWRDVDHGWTLEMAVPIAMLTQHGDRFDRDSLWKLLVGRYNPSRYNPYYGPQLTSFPQIPDVPFHDLQHWATLRLAD
jgi:hypothetical protein